MTSLSHILTATAQIKKAPTITGGKMGSATLQGSSFAISPPVTVDITVGQQLGMDSVLRHEHGLDAATSLLQAFAEFDYGVGRGDILLIDGVDYPVRVVEPWPWHINNTKRYRFLLERFDE